MAGQEAAEAGISLTQESGCEIKVEEHSSHKGGLLMQRWDDGSEEDEEVPPTVMKGPVAQSAAEVAPQAAATAETGLAVVRADKAVAAFTSARSHVQDQVPRPASADSGSNSSAAAADDATPLVTPLPAFGLEVPSPDPLPADMEPTEALVVLGAASLNDAVQSPMQACNLSYCTLINNLL